MSPSSPASWGALQGSVKSTRPRHIEKCQQRRRSSVIGQAVYFGFQKYYESTGDDVLMIHSHKFLSKASNNEKDFLVFNLNKGKDYFKVKNKCQIQFMGKEVSFSLKK